VTVVRAASRPQCCLALVDIWESISGGAPRSAIGLGSEKRPRRSRGGGRRIGSGKRDPPGTPHRRSRRRPRAYERDWRVFADCSVMRGRRPMPAAPDTVAAFLAAEAIASSAPSQSASAPPRSPQRIARRTPITTDGNLGVYVDIIAARRRTMGKAGVTNGVSARRRSACGSSTRGDDRPLSHRRNTAYPRLPLDHRRTLSEADPALCAVGVLACAMRASS